MDNSVSETSLSGDILRYLRYQLRGRRGVIVAAIAVGAPALWLGWPWLVVAGVAPVLLALAPCAIMCALGLCMRHVASGASGTEASGSNLASGEASCCSKPQSVDETAVSMTADKSAEGSAEPVPSEAPLPANSNLVDDSKDAQPEETEPLSGATIKQKKETFQ
ncbi:hypothetical protein [Chelativorans intermedius]|uniref:Uncharacterized protein n=1 Tax=Chelativorans intermedius TaxID=515947 RepID=A0ABV6DC31_9HYPH|nr:hypothetical protein [Chelativorans intermedius]MCT9000336.1 hypothetical protein [Chelativorans intermedius]